MIKRNENKQGYKNTKVGWIPEEWNCVSFGELVSKSQYGLSKATSEGGKVPIMGMSNLQSGKIVSECKKNVSISNDEFEKFRVKKYDFLFNRTNSFDLVGKTALAIEDMPCVFASYLVRFSLSGSPVLPLYVTYYFNLHNAITRLKALATPGVSQYNINPTTLQEHFYISLPSLPEQKKIAEILSAWDRNIERVSKLIEAKEKRFKALVQTLISNQCNSWDHLKGKEVFNSISEKNHLDGELLSVTQDRGVIPRTLLAGKVMSPEGSTAMYKLIKKGDFVISLRSFQGGIEYSRYQGIISPAYTVIRPKIKLHDDYFRHFFKTYLFIEKYLRIAVIGIRDGKQISIPDFMTVEIPYPPLDQQKQIGSILNTAQQEINFLKSYGETYCKQKRGLMQKLLTGEIRVKI